MSAEGPRKAWIEREPGRLIGRGHTAGDFLEAFEWQVLEEREGFLRVQAHLPDHARNPAGQLFGGFTPTYVDLVSLFVTRAGRPRAERMDWLATTNLRVDYFEPVMGPNFVLESRVVKERGRTVFVETRFLDPADEKLLVFATATMRRVAFEKRAGDG